MERLNKKIKLVKSGLIILKNTLVNNLESLSKKQIVEILDEIIEIIDK